MKRRILTLLTLVCLLLALAIPAFAGDGQPVVDDAAILSIAEEQKLQYQLSQLRAQYSMDIVVVTTLDLEGKSPMAYADDFFDYGGYGQGYNRDGILLLISINTRDWWISTSGRGITVFTDAGIDYIGDQIVPMLGDEDYSGACMEFASQCELFLEQAATGAPFDSGNLPKGSFPFGENLLICAIIGAVVTLIVALVLIGQLKSVRKQPGAHAYMIPGSMAVTIANDFFLYRNVDRVKKQTSSSGSSTHTSSSGHSHGGGGGKF